MVRGPPAPSVCPLSTLWLWTEGEGPRGPSGSVVSLTLPLLPVPVDGSPFPLPLQSKPLCMGPAPTLCPVPEPPKARIQLDLRKWGHAFEKELPPSLSFVRPENDVAPMATPAPPRLCEEAVIAVVVPRNHGAPLLLVPASGPHVGPSQPRVSRWAGEATAALLEQGHPGRHVSLAVPDLVSIGAVDALGPRQQAQQLCKQKPLEEEIAGSQGKGGNTVTECYPAPHSPNPPNCPLEKLGLTTRENHVLG